MRNIDFSSWQGVLVTLAGIALVTLIGVGIRLLMMFTVQGRRERMNRQINERLRTLIAAYKVLGGSFTGDLSVDPRHLRDLRQAEGEGSAEHSDRARRVRDAVEGALSDVILLGTQEQVHLATGAVAELLAGHAVRTDALVIALRTFIRGALDLDPVPPDLVIPMQGPARVLTAAKGKTESGSGGGKGGADKSGGMAMGGMGGGIALGSAGHDDTQPDHQ